jgi:ABC-2 type transport system ATP-binding protein
MSEYAIDIQDLTKTFDHKTVVNHVNLQVKKGSVFGFLGSNGSGKTTMIRMICGLLTPTSGSGRCLGYDIKTQSAEIKTKIGYMPQRFSLYSGLTVYENLQFFANIYLNRPLIIPNAATDLHSIESVPTNECSLPTHGMSTEQVIPPKQAIQNILEELELTPYVNQKAGNLSGGWKQRLALACCLLHKPELLFLDEPTAGVDPKARKDFWNYLHKIAMRDGTTVLVTTHYMDEAEKCTELAYINLGRLLYTGSTRELIPFSKVQTYVVEGSHDSINQLNYKLSKAYPQLLVSVVNNDLRISSRDTEQLHNMTREENAYVFKAVTPSFEEVFIGLMQ